MTSRQDRRRPENVLVLLTAMLLLLLIPTGETRASVLVSSWSVVKLYDDDGRFVRDLPIDPMSGNFTISRGPGTDLLVARSRGVDRYDGLTGESKGRFAQLPDDVSYAFPRIHASVYRPDSDLLVLGSYMEEADRYDPATGNYLGRIGLAGAGGAEPSSITVGPDGDLYIGTVSPRVYRVDGTTFGSKGIAVTNTLPAPEYIGARADSLVFLPDGDLIIGDYGNDRLVRFDGETGDLLGVFSEGDGLSYPANPLIGPGGDLLVLNHGTDQILRLDSATGDVLSALIDLPDDFTPREFVYIGDSLTPVENPGPGPIDPVPIPEPTTIMVLAAGLIGFAVRSWRRPRG